MQRALFSPLLVFGLLISLAACDREFGFVVLDKPKTPAAKPKLKIVAADPYASEIGPKAGKLSFTLSGIPTSDFKVKIHVGGTATPNVDYVGIPAEIALSANLTSVDVAVLPIVDDLNEGTETVVVTVDASDAFDIDGSPSATVQIFDKGHVPVLSVSAQTPVANEEDGTPGVFRFSVDQVQTIDLPVLYSVPQTPNATPPSATPGGPTDPGADYQALSGVAAIPAGQSYVDVPVIPYNDDELDDGETVTATLTANAAIKIDAAHPSAVVTIRDNDVLKTIQPVLAVRGMQCTMCHASITSNVVTDFGIGTPDQFLHRAFGITDSANNGARTGWQQAKESGGTGISGSVIVPNTPIGDMPALNDLWNGTMAGSGNLQIAAQQKPNTLKELMAAGWKGNADRTTSMDSIITPANGVDKVIEKSKVSIRMPTADEILTLIPAAQRATYPNVYAEMKAGVTFSGLNIVDGDDGLVPSGGMTRHKIISNLNASKVNQSVICEGDVVLNGTVYLKNLNLITGPAGCRLYVTESVFIEGPITSHWAANPAGHPDITKDHNLQISSARAILMGFGLHRLGVYTTAYNADGSDPANLRYANHSASANSTALFNEMGGDNCGPFMRFGKSLDTEWSPGAQVAGVARATFFDSIARDARKVGTQMHDAVYATNDAVAAPSTAVSCGSLGAKRNSIEYRGLVLNAPHVHSSYLGRIYGVIVADVANSVVGKFQFSYDPLFSTVTHVFPKYTKPVLDIQ